MGILNVTPDSFSDGGQHNDVMDAVTHGLQLATDGADLIDIGGESTRPGAEEVSPTEELRRVIPVIKALCEKSNTPISIDTTKALVARQALECGATIVNDISGLTFDPSMPDVIAEHDAAVCVMHIQGTPRSMQAAPHYDDVVTEVIQFLKQQVDVCVSAGIAFDRICVDPGIGFGKTAQHNIDLMKALPQIKSELRRPVLVGHSRKRFLSSVLGRSVEERTAGTIGVSIGLAENKADVLRVHDVRSTLDALTAWHAVRREVVQ